MVRSWIYLIILFTAFGCSRVAPINKLYYLNKSWYNGKPNINGYYYTEFDSKSNDSETRWIGYLILFENGLLRHGNYSIKDNLPIERKIIILLEKSKHTSDSWGDYQIDGDSIYLEKILSFGMAPREIEYEMGIIENDTTFRILSNSRLGESFVKKTYKFLPFSTPPDSTGYLYDKLQKKKARELKKRKKGKG